MFGCALLLPPCDSRRCSNMRYCAAPRTFNKQHLVLIIKVLNVQHLSRPSRVCLRIQPARLQTLTVLLVLCHSSQEEKWVREAVLADDITPFSNMAAMRRISLLCCMHQLFMQNVCHYSLVSPIQEL